MGVEGGDSGVLRATGERCDTYTFSFIFTGIQYNLKRLEAIYKAQTLAWKRGKKDFASCKELVEAAVGDGVVAENGRNPTQSPSSPNPLVART